MSFSPSNQPFKDDIELKSDLRSDTLDTRQEYDLKVSSRRCREHSFISKQEADRLLDLNNLKDSNLQSRART